jgi:hypothetical protein
MPTFTDPIVAIRLSLNGRTGITLYAPPWEDVDGEEWQGFLGDGAKIVLLGSTDELDSWLSDHPDHDLADHPAWSAFLERGLSALQPDDSASYDFDSVYELAAAEPSAENVSALADTVDLAVSVGDCCEDGALRSLLNGTREYRLLVDDEVSYEGRDGKLEWRRLGDTVADSWARALARLDTWLRFEGTAATEEDEGGSGDQKAQVSE